MRLIHKLLIVLTFYAALLLASFFALSVAVGAGFALGWRLFGG